MCTYLPFFPKRLTLLGLGSNYKHLIFHLIPNMGLDFNVSTLNLDAFKFPSDARHNEQSPPWVASNEP